MKTLSIFLTTIIGFFFLSGCEKSEVEPELQLIKVAGAESAEAKLSVDVLAKSGFSTGYHEFYLDVKNESGKSVIPDDVVMVPMMHMAQKSHSAPHGETVASPQAKNLRSFYAVFVMPGGEMGSWELQISVLMDGQTSQINVPVEVPKADNRLISLISNTDGSKLFIALIQPLQPKTGVNDFTIGIWKRQGMMDWPFVDNLIIAITPEMPTMDHGSPNNIDPVHSGHGIYKGRVNFTMDGLWDVHVKIADQGELAGETKFSFDF